MCRPEACGRQEESGLLNIRREEKQVHYLRDAGVRHVGQAGEVGVVGHLAAVREMRGTAAVGETSGFSPAFITFRVPRPCLK